MVCFLVHLFSFFESSWYFDKSKKDVNNEASTVAEPDKA